MAATSNIIPKLGSTSTNMHLKYLLGFFGLTTGSMALAFSNCSKEESIYLEKAKHKLNSQSEPKTICGPDASQYPWSNNPNKNYEFDLVKMRGYFKEERFFVQKTKDGKKGFAVFAPFVTSHQDLNTHPNRLPNTNASGIMVNLGWVPVDRKSEISLDSEPLGSIDLSEYDWEASGVDGFVDKWTEFSYKQEYDEEREEAYPFTDVVGVVRRGETNNPFIGNTNIPSQWIFQYIDPRYMKIIFEFKNDVDFDDHYLERYVDDLEDEESFPIPATKNSFLTSNGTPELYQRWARTSGLMSLTSLAGLAFL
jgi:surfeit locus 1 family protein